MVKVIILSPFELVSYIVC